MGYSQWKSHDDIVEVNDLTAPMLPGFSLHKKEPWYEANLIYGMDYGMDWWNGLMEWTDGMEYQLTKITKLTIVAVAKL